MICKYYHGEDSPPHNADKNYKLWWGGEKLFVANYTDDEEFFTRIKESFAEADKGGHLSGPLIDASIPLDKRILIFYLDLWHGKWFPYDSYDEISNY